MEGHGIIAPAGPTTREPSNGSPAARRRSVLSEDQVWWLPKVSAKQVLTSFTLALVITEIVLFVLAMLYSGGFETPGRNSTFGPSRCSLLEAGGKFSPFIVHKVEYWRLLSAMFIHSGLVTLVISIILQFLLVLPVELDHGKAVTVFLYLLSGFTGYTFSAVASPTTVDTGALASILGVVGFRVANTVLCWTALSPMDRRRVGALEAGAAFIALIAGQSAFVDTYATFVGFVIGCFFGGAYFANQVETPIQSQRVILGMAILAIFFVIFVCAFLLGAGRFPLVQQVVWTTICQPRPEEFYTAVIQGFE